MRPQACGSACPAPLLSHLLALCLLVCLPLRAATPAFQQRVQFVIDAYAHPKSGGPLGYVNIAAKLQLHEDAALCSRSLEELLAAGPTGDMFWMFPITAIAYLDQGQLSDSARQALRRSFKTYMPYRGDTENHWLLYYTSLYLMAQLWPDQNGDQWYTGKSSAENMREAAGWINSWVKLTTTRGQGEYDSPHYMGLYFLSMSYLAEWAKDPAMKKRAAMMLDYLIADYAAENLDGIYVGAHSRVYDRPVVEKWLNVSSDFGWVLFGLGRPMEPPGSYVIFYLLGSAYEPPEILQAHRHRPRASLHPLRTQANAQSLALFRRPARAGLQDHLRAARVRGGLRPGRHAATDPGTLVGCHLERARPAGSAEYASSPCIPIRRCASCRLTSPSRRTRDSPTW